jgi:hypothetical protein
MALVGHRDCGDLEHRRMRARQVLDPRRVDIAPAANDDVLFATDDTQASTRIERAKITGHEPTTAIERLLGGLLIARVGLCRFRIALMVVNLE